MELAFEAAFAARQDLAIYGDNALLLFALQLRYQIEDIDAVAANALTDGKDDKKCDLVYVDREREHIVVAQGYFSHDPAKASAKANKAGDLNTAAGWLFTRPVAELPDRLQPAAIEVRSAIESNQIASIQFWYVHNLPESENVRDELRTVANTVQNAVRSAFPNVEVPEIVAIEVGQKTLDEWYRALMTPILVADQFDIPTPQGGYEISADDWRAYVTAIPAKWLYDRFATYKDALFSANVRGYLGSRNSERNINNGIKNTAMSDPNHFWVYNNGLTVLVHDFTPAEHVLKIKGLSIVNGAQTTGAIGSLPTPPAESVMVPARFVQCDNAKTVKAIIEYNNKQNQVEPADFRSGDAVQRRLREEFKSIPSATYLGRRGGADDVIRRQSNLIPSDTAAQALAAFQGDPVLAYNEKSRIWVEDKVYSKYFCERTHAVNIVFTYSLLKAVEAKKRALLAEEELPKTKQGQVDFLRQRGATYLLTTAIASCLESFLGRAVPDPFMVSFGPSVSPEQAQEYWRPIVEFTVPFAQQLMPAVKNGLKSSEQVKEAVRNFQNMVQSMIESLRSSGNDQILSDFSSRVVIST